MTVDLPELRQEWPVEPVEVPESLRQTFLRHFERCPYSGYLYLKYEGGPGSHPLDRGSLFHRFAEQATQILVEQEESYMEPEVGRELMTSLIAAETDLVIPDSEQDGLRVMAYHWCAGTVIDPSTVLAIEGKLELTIAGWLITGKVDLALMPMATAIEVRDYKTSWDIPTQADFQRFQTSLYAAGLAKGSLDGAPMSFDHVQVYNLIELYPRYLWTQEGVAYRDVIVQRDELLNRLVTLEGLVARVEHLFETWTARAVPGDHCDECPARHECPLPARLRPDSFAVDTPVIETEEDARRIATRRFFTAKQQRADNKALRAWIRDHGPIRFGRDLVLELETAEQKKLATSREAIAVEASNAANYGTPFNIEDHYRTDRGLRMKETVLSELELEEEREVLDGHATEREAA